MACRRLFIKNIANKRDENYSFLMFVLPRSKQRKHEKVMKADDIKG